MFGLHIAEARCELEGLDKRGLADVVFDFISIDIESHSILLKKKRVEWSGGEYVDWVGQSSVGILPAERMSQENIEHLEHKFPAIVVHDPEMDNETKTLSQPGLV
ncbi:hypothetical protein EW146_g8091 [Bondarzewia mesenterica]|uniref:Uncharacterized protein n=1 Tax=Bondarzewia mesenterica TaxID=1095465 RepID=A0A4S4LIW3_9AGAM|nr:hypothetical protein EW146_g8091 [Bondarzewia mesenterica]